MIACLPINNVFDVRYIETIPKTCIVYKFRDDVTKAQTRPDKSAYISSIVRKFSICIFLSVALIVGIVLLIVASESFKSYVKDKTIKDNDGFRKALSDPNMSEDMLRIRYNKAVYASTHNSYAIFPTVKAANQWEGIYESLAYGVRALMLDVHFRDNTKSSVALCHGPCEAGSVEINEVFNEIADFLVRYPTNVITIIWETPFGLTEADQLLIRNLLYSIIENSRLAHMLYEHPGVHATWPKLGEMVDTGKKLVQFFDRGPFNRPWDLNMWTYVIETPYDNKKTKDLNAQCVFNRGQPDTDEKLFLNNHFTLQGLVSPTATSAYNYNPYLYNRIIRCEQELNKKTNFVCVDHWHASDVARAVYCLSTTNQTIQEMCQQKNEYDTMRIVGITLIAVMGFCLCLFGCEQVRRKRSKYMKMMAVQPLPQLTPLSPLELKKTHSASEA